MYVNTDTSGSDTIAVTRQIRVANGRAPEAFSVTLCLIPRPCGRKKCGSGTTCTVCVEDCEGRQLPGVVAQWSEHWYSLNQGPRVQFPVAACSSSSSPSPHHIKSLSF